MHFDDGFLHKVPRDFVIYPMWAGAAAEQPSHSGLAAVGPVGVGPVGAKKGAVAFCLRVMAIVGLRRVDGAQR